MASIYYGRRGSDIKRYQQQLNQLGAKLSVDGIWGPRTENAYNQYRTQLDDYIKQASQSPKPVAVSNAAASNPAQAGSVGGKTPTLARSVVTPRSKQELEEIARGRYDGQYDRQIAQLRENAQIEEQQRREAADALPAEYARRQRELEDTYGRARQSLSDQTLKRGFGRSSYATDLLSQAHAQENEQIARLGEQRDAQQQSLEREIAKLLKDARDQELTLNSERAERIRQAMDELAGEDSKAQQDALRYNNDLALEEYKLQLSRDAQALRERQAEVDMAIKKQQAAAKTAGKTSGGSSTSGSKKSAKKKTTSAKTTTTAKTTTKTTAKPTIKWGSKPAV